MQSMSESVSLDVPCPRHPFDCPVEEWLSFLGHRWNALILWHLSTGQKRYFELTTLLPGITAKVMSERLDALAHRELISRSAIHTFPRGTVYSLTERGRSLTSILDHLEQWAAERPSDR